MQLLLPDADISAGPWDAPMWSVVNTDDGDSISAAGTGEGIVGLPVPPATPGPVGQGVNPIVYWKAYMSKSGSILRVRLYEGSTVMWTSFQLTDTSPVLQSEGVAIYEVLGEQPDYSDLRIGVEVESYGGKGARLYCEYLALAVPDAPFEGSQFRTWDGSQWVAGKLKRYDGSSWQPAQVQRWNGSAWENVP